VTPAATGTTLLLVAVTLALFLANGTFGDDPVSNALMLAAVASYAVVGGLIASRFPGNATGWLLLLIGLGLVASVCAEELSTFASDHGRVTLSSWSLWVNSWLLVATAWPGVVAYLLVFPTGSLPSWRWRPLLIALVPLSVAGVVVRIVQPWTDGDASNPLGVESATMLTGFLFVVIALAFAGAGILAVVSVVLRFRRASSDRWALRWLAVVVVVAAGLLVMAIAVGALGFHRIGDPLGVAFLLVLIAGLPASAAAALLSHRLYGVEVWANRSVVYGTLVVAITVLYAIVVAAVGVVVGRGDRASVLAAVAATAIAAVAFQPARRRAQRFANRLLYGDRVSPYELIATFTERLDEVSIADILPRMSALIAEGTGADRVRIWLRSDAELRPVAAWPPGDTLPPATRLDAGGLPTFDDPAFPVRHAGDLLGAITVGLPPSEPITPATERLLADLATQAGLVLRNVALVEELQRSRQRLVSSQDEARRRLERDLHDGAQQRLVTLSLDLRMARDRADAAGDIELTGRLAGAEQELARSLAELRELARGIHPAILTQNGLGAALRSLAERSVVPVELRCALDRRYPAEVEATAYFMVSEALANVAKHAGASRVVVTVDEADDRLSIEVRDDGVGGATVDGGSGLRGLADRVEAVGGRIDVRSGSGSGTVILAVMPCG
jgi:signal transduction histidine kinase